MDGTGARFGTPAATKPHTETKTDQCGVAFVGGDSEVDFGKPPGFVVRFFGFCSALDFFSGVDIPASSTSTLDSPNGGHQ